MRTSVISFAFLLLVPTVLADSFVGEKVKVGKRTCTCSFTFVLVGDKVSKDSKVSCDTKCSGSAKDVKLGGDGTNLYTVAFSVKKGKGKIQEANVELVTRTTTNTTTTTATTTATTTTTNTTTTTATTTTIPCEDNGCSKEWDGMGACVNVSNANWTEVDVSFNLSVPGIPGKCGPESCCVCLQKKLCADEGCSKFFDGFGVCLNALDPEFAETSPLLDFQAEVRDDLCAGCCSCFKKSCLDTVHGSVAFAVDTTGSMQKSLPLVKATILSLVQSGSHIPKWILTDFNDPSVHVVKETESSEELKLAAEALSFSGGGDANEQALQGIEVTLDTMSDNGVILVFTDTGSHQLELENAVKEKSEMKNVKIFFALFQEEGVIDTASMDVYEHLSNGQIFFASSDGSLGLDTEKFFEAVVHTVQHPCD